MRATGSVSLGFEEALDLVLCGVLVAGLMFLAQRFQLDLPSLTFYAGLAGAALCVGWGTLGSRTRLGRPGAIATLIVVVGVLARQAYLSWEASGEREAKVRIVAMLMTTLAVLCAGTCVNLMKTERILERDPPAADAYGRCAAGCQQGTSAEGAGT